MNIFSFRNQIIEDYSGYVSSFISIAQPRLRDFVDRCFTLGSLWPDPLIQLNPTFKPGETVDELVTECVLEPGCSQIFRREKTAVVDSGEDLLFHQHQEEAIRKAKEKRNYVLTTGTGSGQSLAYFVPGVLVARSPGHFCHAFRRRRLQRVRDCRSAGPFGHQNHATLCESRAADP